MCNDSGDNNIEGRVSMIGVFFCLINLLRCHFIHYQCNLLTNYKHKHLRMPCTLLHMNYVRNILEGDMNMKVIILSQLLQLECVQRYVSSCDVFLLLVVFIVGLIVVVALQFIMTFIIIGSK